MAIGEVSNGSQGAIVEPKADLQVVTVVPRQGADFDGVGAGPPAHGIDEVPPLTDEAGPFEPLGPGTSC